MSVIGIIGIIVAAFLGMEIVSWVTHRYLMHGLLWSIHLDHHTPAKKGIERNDLFALFFSLPSVILLIISKLNPRDPLFWAGMGIVLYGIVYFLYHDVLIHKRLNLMRDEPRSRFLKAVVNAHLDHHRGKENYGFFFMIHWRYFREAFSR